MDANNGQRARGVGGRGRRGRGQRREGRRAIFDEIRATLLGHVINHGLDHERGWTESPAQLESIYSGVHNSNIQK
jgi:hypothetical protein